MEDTTNNEQQLDGNGAEFSDDDVVTITPAGDAVIGDHDGGEPDPMANLPWPRRLKMPEQTGGHYVVLFALKPKKGERAQYTEVACVKAHDSDHAKRVVLENDGRSPKPFAERGDVARWLLERAGERGILLRALPAMHWPGDVEPTSFERPAPVLKIG